MHPRSHPSEFQALAANQSDISSQFSVPETPDLFKLDCLDEFVYVGMLDTQHERLQLTIKVWQSPKTTENKEFYHGKHWSLGRAIITSVLLQPQRVNTEDETQQGPIFQSWLLPIASVDRMGGDVLQSKAPVSPQPTYWAHTCSLGISPSKSQTLAKHPLHH